MPKIIYTSGHIPIPLPLHLSHTPIIACKYEEIAGYACDAKFISVGKAQYSDNSASVKIWRKTDSGRWSRQSEEVPVVRLPYMMSMLLSAIIYAQADEDGITPTPTRACEHVIMDEQIAFLREQLSEREWRELSRGILEMVPLLEKIDLARMRKRL